MIIFCGGLVLLCSFIMISIYFFMINDALQRTKDYKKRLDAGEISDDWKHTERVLAGGILFSGGLYSAYLADVAHQFVKILDERLEEMKKKE